MATIIYTVDLNTSGQVVNFKNLYENNEEVIKETNPIISNNNKFYPITLQVNSGEMKSNKRTIYLHIGEKDKEHYAITMEQYQTYKNVIDVTDVVIFINDDENVSEIEELKKYLNIE